MCMCACIAHVTVCVVYALPSTVAFLLQRRSFLLNKTREFILPTSQPPQYVSIRFFCAFQKADEKKFPIEFHSEIQLERDFIKTTSVHHCTVPHKKQTHRSLCVRPVCGEENQTKMCMIKTMFRYFVDTLTSVQCQISNGSVV